MCGIGTIYPVGRNQIRRRVQGPDTWEVVRMCQLPSSFECWDVLPSCRGWDSPQQPVWKERCSPGFRVWTCLLKDQGLPGHSQAQPAWHIGAIPCPPLSPLKAVTLPSRLCRKSFSAVTLERKREHNMLTDALIGSPICGSTCFARFPSPSAHLR